MSGAKVQTVPFMLVSISLKPSNMLEDFDGMIPVCSQYSPKARYLGEMKLVRSDSWVILYKSMPGAGFPSSRSMQYLSVPR